MEGMKVKIKIGALDQAAVKVVADELDITPSAVVSIAIIREVERRLETVQFGTHQAAMLEAYLSIYQNG